MRPMIIAYLIFLGFTQIGFTQMSVNPDWNERNGLTVASSQRIAVSAKKLRVFTTLRISDSDPRQAINKLNEAKTTVIKSLRAIGVAETAINFTSPQFAEWEHSSRTTYYYRQSDGIFIPSHFRTHSAVTYLSFDVPIETDNEDEITLLPYEISKKLSDIPELKLKKVVMLYIGEVDETQITEVNKRAYDEAMTYANSIAELSGRKLGKLQALTPQIDGRWRYRSDLTYGSWNYDRVDDFPQANFHPSENELFGTNPQELSRTYSIELRFEIE
ncbi:MAG: SIMPL domain-containing protein [Pirellulaceae bacterium]|nr:SIMPL domain-containing protein [Pirellulaceae bacterium]